MAFEVRLPDIGEGVAEGEIVRWLVKAGDAVREDQPLVEVMTDKASVEIPSPRTGTIASLHAEEGETVPVGTVIVTIAVVGESAATPAATSAAHAPSHAATHAATHASAAPVAAAAMAGRVEATPAVRALARESGVALERVQGTGPGGRITAEDVRAAAAGAAAATPSAAANSGPETRVPLRGMRRRIAEHMRRSLSTAAQFTFVAECDFTGLVEHRRSMSARAEAAGLKLTYLAYVFRALPGVLREFPLLNASLDDAASEVVLKGAYHLGLATNTDDGLTVPIIHDADKLGLFALAREIARLADGARTHKLELRELQGGTFTVTSTGTRGGLLATPILHHPQVAILGVHAITQKPAVVHGQIVARDMGNLSLSLDHRVVDGQVGADFLYTLIERLQKPGDWLTEGDFA